MDAKYLKQELQLDEDPHDDLFNWAYHLPAGGFSLDAVAAKFLKPFPSSREIPNAKNIALLLLRWTPSFRAWTFVNILQLYEFYQCYQRLPTRPEADEMTVRMLRMEHGIYDRYHPTVDVKRLTTPVQVAEDNQMCVICQDTVSKDALKINKCGHVFCRAEIVKWLETSTTCPTCRSDLRP